jgi:hypothetical protein
VHLCCHRASKGKDDLRKRQAASIKQLPEYQFYLNVTIKKQHKNVAKDVRDKSSFKSLSCLQQISEAPTKRKLSFLDDKVMDAYFAILDAQYNNVRILSAHVFEPALTGELVVAADWLPHQLLPEGQVQAVSAVLVPMHQHEHWRLGVVDCISKRIYSIDPLKVKTAQAPAPSTFPVCVFLFEH